MQRDVMPHEMSWSEVSWCKVGGHEETCLWVTDKSQDEEKWAGMPWGDGVTWIDMTRRDMRWDDVLWYDVVWGNPTYYDMILNKQWWIPHLINNKRFQLLSGGSFSPLRELSPASYSNTLHNCCLFQDAWLLLMTTQLNIFISLWWI